MDLFTRIETASPLLHRTGWAMLAAALGFLLAGAIDPTQLYGINIWIKPIKFALSIALFVWTMALILEPLGPWSARPWLARAIALAMIVEMALIGLQAARGVASHYNIKTGFDAAVFQVMGFMIVVNTVATAGVFLGYVWRDTAADPLVANGIRAGLLLFLAGSLVGMLMVANMGHTIGAPDGGPGLPFLNWSTTHGDLRVAHAAGLHALQALPLIALLLLRLMPNASRTLQTLALLAASFLYLAAFVHTLRQAISGQPLLRL